MQKMKVIIVGAGGHGKVVADALLKENKYLLVGFADDQLAIGSMVFENYKVICIPEEIKNHGEGFILAIGNNKIRAEKFNSLKRVSSPITVIHPFSSIAADVILGAGTVVLAGTVINASAVIGENCIINSRSFIDHDTIIDNHSHIGQCAVVGSGNKLKEFTWVKQSENIISVFH